MPKTVYVVGGQLPYGGAHMAYHVARMLHVDFGYDMRVVAVGAKGEQGLPGPSLPGDPVFHRVTLDESVDAMREDDVLVCNPSFSCFNLGLRARARKLMYVQGFTTFSVLDCFFDRYVAVSDFVRGFLSQTYGIEARVIPAFVQGVEHGTTMASQARAAWDARPAFATHLNLKSVKGDWSQQFLLLERIRRALKAKDRDLEESIDWNATIEAARSRLPRHEFLARLAAARYLITLSVAEGFGLVPLEAMSVGTVVLGFDGFGGRHYMMPGHNCAVAAYPDVDGVVDGIVRTMRDPAFARGLSAAGVDTASRYTYESFRGAWLGELTDFLA